jgi:hypothetical protein
VRTAAFWGKSKVEEVGKLITLEESTVVRQTNHRKLEVDHETAVVFRFYRGP